MKIMNTMKYLKSFSNRMRYKATCASKDYVSLIISRVQSMLIGNASCLNYQLTIH